MELEIVDLEDFTTKKALYAKLGDYKINVNDIPLKVALKVQEYYKAIKSGKELDMEFCINEIVVPIIIRQYPKATLEDIEKKFNYDQLLKILSMIFNSFLSAGSDSERNENKKKRRVKLELIKLLAHLANTYSWSEETMMNMSLSKLLSYYVASFSLPYIFKQETVEKNGLWEISVTNE